METVVAVAIGILITVFTASLVGLIFVCYHRYCKKEDHLTSQMRDTRPDVQLIEEESWRSKAEVELDSVQISNLNLDQILQDENWVDDVTVALFLTVYPILKICHQLTERLVEMTMENSHQVRTEELLTDIITVSKRIGPRVDEVVQSMYPPLDARLLEARCTALVLSVSHLVLVTKHACKNSGKFDWIDQYLADVDEHLKVLREATLELDPRSPSNSTTSGDSQQPIVRVPSSENVSSRV